MQYDLTSTEFAKSPLATYRAFQADAPLVRQKFPIVGEVWFATTQSACAQVLKNPDVFSVTGTDGRVVGLKWWMPRIFRQISKNMLSIDNPDHKRLRGIVDHAFRRERIKSIEPRIEALATEMAEGLFAEGQTADLVTAFARPFPLAVICEMLGLRKQDRAQFSQWADSLSDVTGTFSFLRVAASLRKIAKFLKAEIKRVEREGGEGLIAELVAGQATGDALSSDELISMVFLLLFAGHETTTHLISGSMHLVLEDNALRKTLLEDDEAMPLAVEELLRVATAVILTKPRYVRRDIKIDGVSLKQGQKVLAFLGSANHDSAAFDAPEKVKFDRRPNKHMSFGTGIHFCLGHQLARLELQHALAALLKTHPDLHLVAEPQWRGRVGMRALADLRVSVGK